LRRQNLAGGRCAEFLFSQRNEPSAFVPAAQGRTAQLIAAILFAIVTGLFQTASTAHGADFLAPAPGAQVTTLNRRPGYFSEPSVAINPLNPRQVVVAFQVGAQIAYSEDAGEHWQLAAGTRPKNYRVSGDVSVAYDNKGNAILCYIAFDKLGTYNYWAHGATRNGIYIRRSLDGGKTWERKDIPVIEEPTAPRIPFEDKPYLVADDSSGPYAGNLYVAWTHWTLTNSEILFSRSTNDGETWSKPKEIDRHPGLPRDDNGANEGFAGVVGPRGVLYTVWGDGNHIVFTLSRDGGRTFEPARNIIHTAPTMFHVDDVSRANGFPEIAIDPKTGRLYVTWSDYRNGEVDVFLSNSINHGETWSPAVKVNTDPAHDGDDHYFQWLAVDPSSGEVYVVFYDRRDDPENRKQIVVLARSRDGGRSFANYAWTQEPFDADGVFIGDYTGLAAYNGRVYGAWTAKPSARNAGTVVRVGVADFR
jgi:hypothetical protein